MSVEQNMVTIHVGVDEVVPNPHQPRQVFDEDDLRELASSIAAIGLLQPIVVRPGGPPFVLVAGERRLRAARLAGLVKVPAVLRETEDARSLEVALAENLFRANLNPLEEASAYRSLMDDHDLTQEELAARLGKSRQHVGQHLALLKLPPAVQRRVAAGVLSYGHARVLVGVKDPWTCDRLASRVVAEGLSVRALEEIVVLGDLPGWEDDLPGKPPRQRGPRLDDGAAALEAVSESLEALLDTKVRVSGTSKRGRLVIEYAGLDDLMRVARALGVDPRGDTQSVVEDPSASLIA